MIFHKAALSDLSPLFIDVLYYRSPTAELPVKKSFKRFPVELDKEYFSIIYEGYINGDFNKMDVLIEVVNFQFEIQEFRADHQMSFAQYDAYDNLCNNLLKNVGIIVK